MNNSNINKGMLRNIEEQKLSDKKIVRANGSIFHKNHYHIIRTLQATDEKGIIGNVDDIDGINDYGVKLNKCLGVCSELEKGQMITRPRIIDFSEDWQKDLLFKHVEEVKKGKVKEKARKLMEDEKKQVEKQNRELNSNNHVLKKERIIEPNKLIISKKVEIKNIEHEYYQVECPLGFHKDFGTHYHIVGVSNLDKKIKIKFVDQEKQVDQEKNKGDCNGYQDYLSNENMKEREAMTKFEYQGEGDLIREHRKING